MGAKVQDKAAELERNYGECNMYISNMDTDAEPFFSGTIRVNGVLYSFDNEQATGWAGIPIDTVVYARVVPSGDAATIEYTNEAPVYDTTKFGYYGVGEDTNKRYITDTVPHGYLRFGKYDATTYTYKHIKNSGRYTKSLLAMPLSTGTLTSSLSKDDIYKIILSYGYDSIIQGIGFIRYNNTTSITNLITFDINLSRIIVYLTGAGGGIQPFTQAKGDTSSSLTISGITTVLGSPLYFRLEK